MNPSKPIANTAAIVMITPTTRLDSGRCYCPSHCFCAGKGCPQLLQRLLPITFSLPQLGQVMLSPLFFIANSPHYNVCHKYTLIFVKAVLT